MTKPQAKKRIERLKKVVSHHRYLYHVLDKQEISAAALDSLKKELFDLEQQYPEFITPDSPTQRIAGKPLEKFSKVRHPRPMLSFNDAFSKEDMQAWLERISKLLTEGECRKIDFYGEPKFDGLAIELIYEKDVLEVGSTRGDGLIGENVTQNLKTIEAIPLRLRSLHPQRAGKGKQVVVRGEVFVTKKEFAKINKQQERQGLPVFANPRNMAAGSIRQLDSKMTASRHLDFYAYDIIYAKPDTHQEKHQLLKLLGFKTDPHCRYLKNLKAVFEFHQQLQEQRAKLAYEIDGLVVQINNNKIFDKLGVVGKAPRAAIAFKFPLKQAATLVEDIVVQVGRTGALTPVAVLKPVAIGGVTITRATLHNEDEIKRLGIRVGDTVIVGRAGDVIPDVIKVLPKLRTGQEKEFRMSQKCPACGSKTFRSEGEAVWRCPNPKCFAQKYAQFSHFVSKGAFDIVGLGPKIVNQLIQEGLVSDPADLFELEEGDLLPLERFAEKSAQNLIKSIKQRKEVLFSKFIFALGIRNVGEQTSIDLSEHFASLDNLKKASVKELESIIDIGPIVASSIYNWFRNEDNLKFLDKLDKTGVKIKFSILKLKSPCLAGRQACLTGRQEKLKGKVFVLTGSLETMSRDEAKTKIRELGGEVSESVSAKTDYVVAGKEPGSKYDKAKNLGVKTIGEKEFLAYVCAS